MRKGSPVLKSLLCQVSHASVKTKSQFAGRYKALVIRRGKKRAIIATAHKLLEVAFIVITREQPYRDPGINYEAFTVERNAPRWLKALRKYGYVH